MAGGLIIRMVLSAAAPQGLGSGKVGYGIYEVSIVKHETKAIASGENEGFLGTSIWTEVTGGTDPDMIGRQIVVYEVWAQQADIDEGRIDPIVEKRKFDAMTAKSRRFTMATAMSEEAREKLKKRVGSTDIDLDNRLPTKRKLFMVYDPADEDAAPKQHDDHRWLFEDEYKKALDGKLRVGRKNTYGLTDEQALKAGARRVGKADREDNEDAGERRGRKADDAEVAGAGWSGGKGKGGGKGETAPTEPVQPGKPGKGKGKGKPAREPEPEPEETDEGGDDDADASAEVL